MSCFAPSNKFLSSTLLISCLIGGCTSSPKIKNNDPWETSNRIMHNFNNDLDSAIIKPINKHYSSVMPEWIVGGTANFFSNLKDIGVTINDLMQLKMAQGAMDGSRFLINTTVGVAGLIDVANMIDLPKHNEDFGQTLGFWGVPTGNYLVVPFLGASSPREIVGVLGDALLNPLTYTFLFAGSGAIFSSVNTGSKAINVSSNSNLTHSDNDANALLVDNYKLMRDTYLLNREQLVSDNNLSDQENPELILISENKSDFVYESPNTSELDISSMYVKNNYSHLFISP